MTADPGAPSSHRRAARAAGLALLLFTLLSVLHFTIVELHLIVVDDTARAVEFIRSREGWFRSGIVLDCVIFASGIVAFASLYALLRDVDRLVALLGLMLMLMQAALAIAVELSSFAALQLLGGEAYMAAFTPEQRHALLGVLLDTRAAGYVMTLLFFSPAWAAFLYLFLRSGRLPRGLAFWGLLSFLLALASTALGIGIPERSGLVAPTRMASQVSATSAILFQLAVGAWLLLKGGRER